MQELGLPKQGMLPREIREAVKGPYKDKYLRDVAGRGRSALTEPSASAIARAYQEYIEGTS
jgi:hypothetical protein